jgi:hypothetical protein
MCTECDEIDVEEEDNTCADCECDPCDCCPICESAQKGTCDCCTICDQTWCECCYNCGEPCMNPCDECGCCASNCDCCSGMGHSETPPWERRGQYSSAEYAKNPYRHKSYSKTWPLLAQLDDVNEGVDPIVEVADFYMCEALMVGAMVPQVKIPVVTLPTVDIDNEFFELMGIEASESQVKILRKRNEAISLRRTTDPLFNLGFVATAAKEYNAAQVERLDPIFIEYSHLAIGGELRHHRGVGGRFLTGVDRAAAWSEWRGIFEAIGVQALLDAADLFEEFDDGSYGGVAWANPCRVLYDRLEGNLGPDEATNKRIFIDRIWTLEHNGGCFLDKLCWAVKNYRGKHVGDIRGILDAHASDPVNFAKLYRYASDEVKDLAASAVMSYQALGFTPDWAEHLTAEPRWMCNDCGSNPKLGHTQNCYNRNYMFGGKSVGKSTPWKKLPKSGFVAIYPEDDSKWAWQNWHADDSGHQYYFDMYGDIAASKPKLLNDPETMRFDVSFIFMYESTGRGLVSDTVLVKNLTYDQLMNKKFYLKHFGKFKGPLGEVHSWSYNLQILNKGIIRGMVLGGSMYGGSEFGDPIYCSKANLVLANCS